MYALTSDRGEEQLGGTSSGPTTGNATEEPERPAPRSIYLRVGETDEIAFEIQRRDRTIDHVSVRFEVPAFFDVTRGGLTYEGPMDDGVLTVSRGLVARSPGSGNVTTWFEIPEEDVIKLGPTLAYVVEG